MHLKRRIARAITLVAVLAGTVMTAGCESCYFQFGRKQTFVLRGLPKASSETAPEVTRCDSKGCRPLALTVSPDDPALWFFEVTEGAQGNQFEWCYYPAYSFDLIADGCERATVSGPRQ